MLCVVVMAGGDCDKEGSCDVGRGLDGEDEVDDERRGLAKEDWPGLGFFVFAEDGNDRERWWLGVGAGWATRARGGGNEDERRG